MKTGSENEMLTVRDTTTEAAVTLFKQAAVVPGVSRKERPVAEFVKDQLKELNVRFYEDSAGTSTGGNCGNLIVIPNHVELTKPVTAFLAHMDTARETAQTVIHHENGKISSDGNSQLGADNRAGVALLLWYLRELSGKSHPANIICIFTVSEEIGMLGAKHLNTERWNIKQAFVFDSSLDPGHYIADCAGMELFKATFKGKAAHSAVSNGSAISAISIAARAITEMTKHELKPGMTSNIGIVSGGTATNVVAPECTIEGEVRGFSEGDITHILNTYKTMCSDAATTFNGKVSWHSEVDFVPYSISPDSELREHLTACMIAAGLKPVPETYSGGSDANAINAKGIPAINLGIGARNPHSNEEYILEQDFRSMIALINELHKRNYQIS